MAKISRVSGMKNILSKMKIATAGFEMDAERRLMKAGRFLQRESQKVVPVDTSNLKAGADTVNAGGKGFLADIVVFFRAVYAVFVHENLEARHKLGKRAKFLESIAREKKSEIFKIIAKG